MTFQLIGVNHKSAPVEVRERLAIPESHLPDALKRLIHHPGVNEAMIVSTCNRVELLARAQNGGADLRQFLGEYCLWPEDPGGADQVPTAPMGDHSLSAIRESASALQRRAADESGRWRSQGCQPQRVTLLTVRKSCTPADMSDR